MIRTNENLLKISAISEVNNFCSRKAWTPMKRSVTKSKVRDPVPNKWVFKSKEEPCGLIHLR